MGELLEWISLYTEGGKNGSATVYVFVLKGDTRYLFFLHSALSKKI